MSDQARSSVIDFLRRELVGPDPSALHRQSDGEEILKNDPPRIRYGAGVLFPQATASQESLDVASDEVTAEPASDGAEEAGAVATDGTVEDGSAQGDAETIDEAVSLANAFLPSAMGISFLAGVPAEGIVVDVAAATYEAKSEVVEGTDGKRYPQRSWLRRPFRQSVSLSAADLTGEGVVSGVWPVARADAASGLRIHVVSRPRREPHGERLITLSLVNAHASSSGRADNEKCFFQVELRVRSADRSACFLEYPEPSRFEDEEEESMALLYRHRKTYSIGHGCAARWVEATEGRACEVSADVLPAYEMKPIVPTRFPDLALQMIDLSDLRDENNVTLLLGRLCDRYEEWISEQQSSVEDSGFPPVYRGAATRHLESCRRCLARMRAGVALLGRDATVRNAFRLANRAMLLQQLHYALDLREWRGGERDTPTIDPVTWPVPETPPPGKGGWYPFQIAFILMNLQSLADPTGEERGLVDLIWFPTGGGKTEAYLGLTAFTVILRRLRNPDNGGTTVLMRYTLRLLTAQQFQRAASLICALETMRRDEGIIPGDACISIGLWAGGDLTPNKRDDAVRALAKVAEGETRENPFILLKCPWCGAQMGPTQIGNRTRTIGYTRDRAPRTVAFQCHDQACAFGGNARLPLLVIDEDIYAAPPTLLIGTVDKFAMLPWQPDARAFFGLVGTGTDPPDLVIQDELHLISGPLGSMVGHYETVILELCTRVDGDRRIRPKVIASTATISRAAEQCHALYNCGEQNVVLFPPQALKAGESFFAREDVEQPGRVYVGVHASALPSHVTAQVRVMSALLQATTSLPAVTESERDPYWTLIGYFNSLRELRHAATLIRADIREYLNAMWLRKEIRKPVAGERDERRFINSSIELTSRIPSGEIPGYLQRLEARYPAAGEELPVDVCFATNMISVGVDVPRLGLMAVVGQPKTTSEYIQATSRVGRRFPGLVVTIYNTAKPRDRSHYEHFRSYHASIYRQVEPTSVTPFSTPVRERALHALVSTLVRYRGTDDNLARPQPFPDEALVAEIAAIIRERVTGVDRDETAETMALLEERLEHWQHVLPPRYGGFGPPLEDVPLMYPAGSEPLESWQNKAWQTPSSMRNVDASCEAHVYPRYPQPSQEPSV